MLKLRDLRHLAKILQQPSLQPDPMSAVNDLLEHPEDYYSRLLVVDPGVKKEREVLSACGELKLHQQRLQKHFTRKLDPSPYSHGGIPGRSIKTNAAPHQKANYLFKTDISNFYPSVSHQRVYRLFVEEFECSPDVARVLTRICTFEHHLALGLCTSPILADQLMRRVDARIGSLCKAEGLNYSRFVDDISISASFDLSASGICRIVQEILSQNGFRLNRSKDVFGNITESGLAITGVRPLRGYLDVRREYVANLNEQMEQARSLSHGLAFTGPYYTTNQIQGRMNFVCWVNPKRRGDLRRKFKSINWRAYEREAYGRGYQPQKTLISKIQKSRSSPLEAVSLVKPQVDAA